MKRSTWIQEVQKARKGGTRCFILDGNTTDWVVDPESDIAPCRPTFYLAALLSGEGYRVGSYSLANGFEEMRPGNGSTPATGSNPFTKMPQNSTPDQMLRFLTGLLRNREHKIALMIDYADHVAPHSQGMNAAISPAQHALVEVLHRWCIDDTVKATENLVFLVSYENQVHSLLTAGYQRVELGLPRYEERRAFIQLLADRFGLPQGPEGDGATGLTVDELARITAGLPYKEIEKLLRTARTEQRPLDYEDIREHKAKVINQLAQGLLEVHEPQMGFEGVKGLANVKEELQRLVRTMRLDPQSAAQAVLLVGVPGCGKSHLVLALAKELGCPCLALRNVREGLVGATERNLERVLWLAETLSPCVLWLDEVDQIIGQRNTGGTMDAGTSERFMGRILSFMGSMSHRGRILWVATSNRPDALDAALLDRFQIVIPFIHPTPQEVADLLPALAAQVGRRLAEDLQCEEIARLESLQNPTVRMLQEVIARAGTLTDVDAGQAGCPIDHAHLIEAANDLKPNYNPLQHQFIALNALRMASFTSMLPWMSRQGIRADVQIPDYLTEIVDQATGAMDTSKLNQRLNLLATAVQQDQMMRRF